MKLTMVRKPASQLQKDVSARLRAVQAEFGKTDEAMGMMVGVSRSVWKNWTNEENFPDEQAMVALCDLAHITLDWIYRGKLESVPLQVAIRLTARLKGMNPNEATVAVLNA